MRAFAFDGAVEAVEHWRGRALAAEGFAAKVRDFVDSAESEGGWVLDETRLVRLLVGLRGGLDLASTPRAQPEPVDDQALGRAVAALPRVVDRGSASDMVTDYVALGKSVRALLAVRPTDLRGLLAD